MNQAQLNTAFPQWSCQRILIEATRDWNLRHSENPCDPIQSSWDFVYAVVHSFLRHSFTDYDSVVTEENREGLRALIHKAAGKAYAWLRLEIDPRSTQLEPKKTGRVFDELSRLLAEHSSIRSAALTALRGAKRQGDGKLVKALEEEIAATDKVIAKLWAGVKVGPNGERNLMIEHKSGQYFWAGARLESNHIEPLSIDCPECKARVYRTKRRIDTGAGTKYYVSSCHCSTYFDLNKKEMRIVDEGGR